MISLPKRIIVWNLNLNKYYYCVKINHQTHVFFTRLKSCIMQLYIYMFSFSRRENHGSSFTSKTMIATITAESLPRFELYLTHLLTNLLKIVLPHLNFEGSSCYELRSLIPEQIFKILKVH